MSFNEPVRDLRVLNKPHWLQAREIGYYHVPPYMATEQGDLVYQVRCVFFDRDRFLGAYFDRRYSFWAVWARGVF